MAAAIPITAAAALMDLAWALARRGYRRQAARLLAGAAFLDHTGIALRRTDIACHDATMDALGEWLDTADLATLLPTGRDRGLHVASSKNA